MGVLRGQPFDRVDDEHCDVGTGDGTQRPEVE